MRGVLVENHRAVLLQALQRGKTRWGHDHRRLIAMVEEEQALKIALGLDVGVRSLRGGRKGRPEGVQALIASGSLHSIRSKADSDIVVMARMRYNVNKLRAP